MTDSGSRPTEESLFPQETAANREQSSWFGKVKLLLFAVAVVLVECLVAYLLIPTMAETSAAASSHAPEESISAEASKESGDHGEEKGEEQLEVDLGKFGVTAYQPGTNTTLLIDFHLYGTVATADREAFALALEEHMHRFRDQVIVIVRSAELTELTDAGLGLMKRKILEKSNRIFGKPYVRSIVFSDFSFVEQ